MSWQHVNSQGIRLQSRLCRYDARQCCYQATTLSKLFTYTPVYYSTTSGSCL